MVHEQSVRKAFEVRSFLDRRIFKSTPEKPSIVDQLLDIRRKGLVTGDFREKVEDLLLGSEVGPTEEDTVPPRLSSVCR